MIVTDLFLHFPVKVCLCPYRSQILKSNSKFIRNGDSGHESVSWSAAKRNPQIIQLKERDRWRFREFSEHFFGNEHHATEWSCLHTRNHTRNACPFHKRVQKSAVNSNTLLP